MKRTCFTLALLLCFLGLSAQDMSLTFEWDLNDPDVTKFRYQLDGELEDGWTECENYETSVSFEDLDFTVPHTLFLQQSYDGLNWSPSSTLSSENASSEEFPEEEFLENEEPFPEEEEEGEEQSAPEETPTSAQAPALPAPVKNGPYWDLGVRVLMKSELSKDMRKTLETGLAFGGDHLWNISKRFSLGLLSNLVVDFYPRLPMKLDSVNLSLMSSWAIMLGDRLYVGFPVGAEIAWDWKTETMKFGGGGAVGVYIEFLISKHFTMKGEGLFHLLTTGQSFSAGMSLLCRF